MFHSQDSISIRRPRAQVYRVAENYPTFVKFYRQREILYKDDAFMRVRVGSVVLGLPTSWVGEGEKTPFEKIQFTQVQGLFKGLTATWHFTDAGDDTIVSIHTRFAFPIPVIGGSLATLVGNATVRKTVRIILTELKREVESQTHG
jgi:ribosome-associated toxin RatA of RatAB toxin-antitoxin module